ncbi:MAG: AMP-binding protein [Pseudomonadota bacterium]
MANNLTHAAASSNFDLAKIDAAFEGSFSEGLNACIECCDRHVGTGRAALEWIGLHGETRTISYDYLQQQSARFANMLKAQGVGQGDRVACMLPRVPELLVAMLGTLRAGAVYQPLFTAFGPKAIEQRISGSEAKLIVTDGENRPKLDAVQNCPPVVSISTPRETDLDFKALLEQQSTDFAPVLLRGDDLFLMLFTSGTTGPPKGVGVPLSALRAFRSYMTAGLDVRPDDRFWNIADPGWAYGLYYSAIGPLLLGNTTTFQEAGFSVEATCKTIREQKITNFAGAPTVYRMMIAAGDDVANTLRGQLRAASSAGEPLNAEVIRWFKENVGVNLHDQYGQTEIAMVMMNHHGVEHAVRPGSAGLPMPGYSLAVLDEAGKPLAPGSRGTLAVNLSQSPLFFFPGYWGREGADWTGDYYSTGDTVEQHEEGDFSFVGRSDDLISSAGYRIGPFDVESSLIEHPLVLESAVVGKPDAERGHIVKAFVVLGQGAKPSDALSEELRLHVRGRLGAHAYPREIAFVDALPKTPSGKVQRFMLRES